LSHSCSPQSLFLASSGLFYFSLARGFSLLFISFLS
jgi:hypothetical protein